MQINKPAALRQGSANLAGAAKRIAAGPQCEALAAWHG